MRALFRILAIPYRYKGDTVEYCVLHRSDCDQWQFIAGGGEDRNCTLLDLYAFLSLRQPLAATSPIRWRSICDLHLTYPNYEIRPK